MTSCFEMVAFVSAGVYLSPPTPLTVFQQLGGVTSLTAAEFGVGWGDGV